MTPLRRRMLEAMRLQGLSPHTEEAYIRAIEQLTRYTNKCPSLVTTEELRSYFLHLQDERKLARSSCIVALSGIKFLFEQVLQREWVVYDTLRPKSGKKQPVILSREEVVAILSRVRIRQHRVCLSTIYACGLRISEGIGLQVSHIDSARMQLHLRQGKGGKDRRVPLPEQTLAQLRQFWTTHRHPVFLFPVRNAGGILPNATRSMSKYGP